jgi:PAS domain-containing protein
LIVILAFLSFAILFTEKKIQQPALFWGMALLIPVAFNLLVITDDVHHLVYPNPHLSAAHPFTELEYDFTYVVYAVSLYVYGATFLGVGLLIQRMFRPHNLYRSQLLTMATGFMTPIALSIFSLFDIKLSAQRDIFPFSTAIGNLVVAFGLFRFRIFDILPIARERVLENMTDPVIVVDALDRVVDINRVALNTIDRTASQVLGQPSTIIFSEWSDLQGKFSELDQQQVEVTLQLKGEPVTFEISVFPIYDRRMRMLGRT